MDRDNLTLGAIKLIQPAVVDAIDAFFITNYEEFVCSVSHKVERIIKELQTQPQIYGTLSEDALTHIIVSSLRLADFNAVKDPEQGGHVDIQVTYPGRDFLWSAEAKLDRSQSHVHEGFVQLTTRYATGLPEQHCGAVIIYNAKHPVAPFLSDVKETLKGKVDQNMTFTACNRLPNQSFYIQVPLNRLGVDANYRFNLRYLAVSLYFRPLDKSGRKAKKYKNKDVAPVSPVAPNTET